MVEFKRVLLVEDSPKDAELTRTRQRLKNMGVNAYVVKPVGFPDFVKALKELGLFWAVVNEPPPGSLRRFNVS